MRLLGRIGCLFVLSCSLCVLGQGQIKDRWSQTLGPRGSYVRAITHTGNTLYAGTSNGVFTSVDNGITWNAINSGLTYLSVGALAAKGSVLFATAVDADSQSSGVFRSLNGGLSWEPANSGLPPPYRYKGTLAVLNDSVFVGTEDGIFVSTNNGQSWQEVDTGFGLTTIR